MIPTFSDMASQYRDVAARIVRIQWSDNTAAFRYDQNVTIGMRKDVETDKIYLQVAADQRMILYEELNCFTWLDDASSSGVAAIRMASTKVVILYNAQDQTILNFFKHMEEFLKQDKVGQSVENLLEAIKRGSSKDAEHAAQLLARSRINIQFNLVNPNVDRSITKSKSIPELPSNILKLTLRIECHLNREPLTQTIYVTSGTDLRTLKEEIETKTGIDRKSQYWYVFDRFLIDDNYVFGSNQPAVLRHAKSTPRNQANIPTDPIRSGDSLIMYIAQIAPYA